MFCLTVTTYETFTVNDCRLSQAAVFGKYGAFEGRSDYLKVHGCRTEAVKCIRLNVVLGLPTQHGEIYVVVFCISVFNLGLFNFPPKDYCGGRLKVQDNK